MLELQPISNQTELLEHERKHLYLPKRKTPCLIVEPVVFLYYRTISVEELFCYFFFNQTQKRATSEFIPNQRSSSLLTNVLYLILKIKTIAVLKSSKPKTTCGGGNIIRALSKRHKKTARSEQGGFFVRSGASVSLFPLRRISTPHISIFTHFLEKIKMSR